VPVLKARIGGAWVPVGGGSDEVSIGPNDPGDTTTELWYDTDEPNLYEPDTARWNSAWGVVATLTNNTDYTGIAAAETWVNSGAFTAVAGRKYSLMVRQHVQQSTNGDAFYIRAAIDGILVVFLVHEESTYHRVVHTPSIAYSAVTSGSKQVYVSLQRISGTGTASALNYNYTNAIVNVIDLGPVALASNPPAQPASVWTFVTFQNGWGNTGGSHQLGAYRLLGDQVQLRGLVKGGTNAAAIFTLPAGYRPTATVVAATNHIVGGNWAFGIVQITTDGAVAPFGSTAPTDVSLNNLSFSVL